MIEIVRAGEEHAAEIAVLFDAYRRFYGAGGDVGAAESFLRARLGRGESVVYLARIGESPAGFAQLYGTYTSVRLGVEWILNDLYVAEAHRRQGVARRLAERVVEFARETGAVSIELLTEETNVAAQALYESLGFRHVHEFRRYVLRLDG